MDTPSRSGHACRLAEQAHQYRGPVLLPGPRGRGYRTATPVLPEVCAKVPAPESAAAAGPDRRKGLAVRLVAGVRLRVDDEPNRHVSEGPLRESTVPGEC